MIKTEGIKYLGSKASFVTEIVGTVQHLAPSEWVALDVFMGSGRVAQMFRQLGFKTLTSEILPAGSAYSNAYICNPDSYRKDVQEIIEYLNQVTPVADWLTNNYGEALPSEDRGAGKMVNALTRTNAMKADAIRNAIESLNINLEQWERDTLITSLILAINRVLNSQGHHRAWFREFSKSAQSPLHMTVPSLCGNPDIVPSDDFLKKYPTGAHFTGSVLSSEYVTFVREHSEGRKIVAYMDPPYTTNLPYEQFYHLWDSVALWDKPSVIGSTNRREDRDTRRDGGAAHTSTWTKRKEARDSFARIYQHLAFADMLVVSYSDESIVPFDDMVAMLEEAEYNVDNVKHKQYQRHALSKTATAGAETRKNAAKHNTEWVFVATKKS